MADQNNDNPLYTLPQETNYVTEDDVRSIIAQFMLNYSAPSKVVAGYLQSQNFLSGVSGWQLNPTGAEINGGVSVTSLNIPDQTTANSFHVDSSGNAWWGANVASGYAGANAYILSTGAAVFKNVQIGGSTIQYVITNSGIFSFGDGSDGTATCDGATAVAGMSRSGNDYTMTRDVYFDSLTVNDSRTINTAGYRIFVKNTLTIGQGVSGKIFRDGPAGGNGDTGHLTSPFGGPGDTSGSTLADGYLKGSVAPGTGGGTDASAGFNPHSGGTGTSTTNSIGTNGVGSAGSGGNGVDSIGGSHAGQGGGSGGTATASNVRLIANWHLATLLDISSSGSTVKFSNSAGAAGGGSGGLGQNNNGGQTTTGGAGGSGGTSGGIVAIYARNIVMNVGARITANGGKGGDGGAGWDTTGGPGGGGSGGGGGGTGGNGGIIILCYNNLTNTDAFATAVTVTAGGAGSGGRGGTGSLFNGSAGTSGSSGSAGTIYQFQLSL